MIAHFNRMRVLGTLVLGLWVAAGCNKAEPAASAKAPGKAVAKAPAKTGGDPAKGKKIYNMVCIACHGPNGEAKPNLGKDIGKSEFVHGKTDDELLAFLKKGRAPGDPLNTSGVAMPPKGGNPALTDEQLRDVIAFVRELQKKRYGK